MCFCKSYNYLVYTINNLTLIITKILKLSSLKSVDFSHTYVINIWTIYIYLFVSEIKCFISIYWPWAIPDFNSQSTVLAHIYDSPSYNSFSCCCSCPIVFLECMWFPNSLTSFQLHQYLTFQVCHLKCMWPLGQHSGNDLSLLYFKSLLYWIACKHSIWSFCAPLSALLQLWSVLKTLQ